jgi:hypothetical protein
MGIEMLLIFGLVVIVFWFVLKTNNKNHKIIQGKKGEEIVARSLNFWLKRSNKTYVYNDITLHTKRGTTQIDHLVLSRKGVFVIETKFLNGWIYGDEDSHHWTHINGLKQKNSIYNPLFQNHSHVRHVANTIHVSSNEITGIVTNVGNARLKGSINPLLGKPKILRGTGFVLGIYFSFGSRFTQDQVNQFRDKIEKAKLEQSSEVNKAHIKYAKKFQRKGKTNLFPWAIVILAVGFLAYKMMY